MIIKPKTAQKVRKYSTTERQTYKDLNHILENYLLKYQNKEVQSKIDN